ncbi:hypothetical protein HN385_02645 [archaeon]|nr:hypothetical protein [archaeon]MBT3450649.1 hypothetical protein [archaeon]MBT6868771.1 hypothetical protein [archaeon]MBT7193008.1 hypothetical protein [archaeon]MBT7380974.1 hypothetical protein [archaeon]
MKYLKNFNNKQLLKILAILVLSDGHLYKHNGVPKNIRLVTSESGEDQHKLFKFLCKKIFGKKTRSRTMTRKYTKQKCLISDFNSVSELPKLLKLSPEYNTTPGNKSQEEYLKCQQPTISFSFNENQEVKWAIIRTYFDFDGSISPSLKLRKKKDMKNEKIYEYFQVQFECEIKISETNLSLVKDLIKLCKKLDLKASIRKDNRNWSKISGRCISEIKSVKTFLNKGGPITNVKISGKSNRFKGISKKIICKKVL